MKSTKVISNADLGIEPNYQVTSYEKPLRIEDKPSKQAVQEEILEASYDVQEVQALSEADLDFFAALIMPTVYKYLYPQMYHIAWNWLKEYAHKVRDFSQLALGLPRGFGKTLFIKLFVVYLVTFTKRQFILILAETQGKGENILADIMDMLQERNYIATFGDWRLGKETDRLELKKFGFRGRNIILMAATVETVRGISLKNARPDVMIFDDIQSRTCADSQLQSETLEREMVGTAMKAKSPHGCLYIFLANMYPTKWSILKRLKSNPNWLKFIVGGLLANGESLWEELQPKSQLIREYINDKMAGRPEVFQAEVLNDETATTNNLVNLNELPANPNATEKVHQGNFIIIDPSNDKVNSDAVSIGYCEIFDETPTLQIVIEGRLSPGDTITRALSLALTHGCSLIAVESNAFQYSLLYWFKYITQQRGIIGINAVEIYSGTRSKNARILDMFKALKAGEIFYSMQAKAAVESQITQFNPLKTNNVDGILDLLTYMRKIIEMYGEVIYSSFILEQQDIGTQELIEHNSPI